MPQPSMNALKVTVGRHLPRSSKWACRSAPVDEMHVDLGTDLRCSLSGLCERTSVRTAHAAAQDLEHGVAGRSIERDRIY